MKCGGARARERNNNKKLAHLDLWEVAAWRGVFTTIMKDNEKKKPARHIAKHVKNTNWFTIDNIINVEVDFFLLLSFKAIRSFLFCLHHLCAICEREEKNQCVKILLCAHILNVEPYLLELVFGPKVKRRKKNRAKQLSKINRDTHKQLKWAEPNRTMSNVFLFITSMINIFRMVFLVQFFIWSCDKWRCFPLQCKTDSKNLFKFSHLLTWTVWFFSLLNTRNGKDRFFFRSNDWNQLIGTAMLNVALKHICRLIFFMAEPKEIRRSFFFIYSFETYLVTIHATFDMHTESVCVWNESSAVCNV